MRSNNSNRSFMPEVNGIYSGEVIDVNKDGVQVCMNYYRKDFRGLLHTNDSPIVRSLIEGDSVKFRIVSCSRDGFMSITTKNIKQPAKFDKSLSTAADKAYQQQRRKIRVVSPTRSETKQFTAPPTDMGIEIINKEPEFMRHISTRIPKKIPTKITIIKDEYGVMARVAKDKNTNYMPPSFYFQQASYNYEWASPRASSSKKDSSPSQSSEQQPTLKERSKMLMTEQRQSLPIYKYREDIIRAVTDNQFLIVEGETGSGKTTQITQYLIEAGFSLKGKIACTQPRRVAAISVAQRVAEEYGCMLGQEVGYKIRFEDVTSPSTIIKYMTDGILLRECLSKTSLENYSVIILDEAHERSIYTDVLFGILKEAAKRLKDLRIVVSSATLDAQKFSKFFNDAKILSIPGSMFPVEVKFRATPEYYYFNAAINTVLNIHMREPAGDILCFLTGQDEIEYAIEIVDEQARERPSEFSNLYAFPLYAALPFEEQTEILMPTPPGLRKVIFSTNIAETSVTIDGIVYVVDCGYVKQMLYDPKTGIEAISIVPISQASADQRCGRAGRTAPGKCYRIYTEDSYLNEMLSASIPDIQRSNMANVILHLKAIGVIDILDFDFMDPPPREYLIAALKELYMLDALDEDGKITAMGHRMAQLPIDPNYAKMLLVSEDLKCTDEIITIVAMLSVPNIFYRPRRGQDRADKRKEAFNHAVGDHLRLLNVFNKWEMNYSNPNWCKNNFLNEKKLFDAYEVRRHLLSILDSREIEIFSAGRNIQRIQLAICAGFFKNIAYKERPTMYTRGTVKSYKTLDTHPETAYLHPSSSLFHQLPQWIVYNGLRKTTKRFLHDVTVINPNWLPVIAKSMYRMTGNQVNYSDKLTRILVQAQRARESNNLARKCDDKF